MNLKNPVIVNLDLLFIMKYSQYNVIHTDGTSTWIFNTLTNAFVKIENPTYEAIWNDAEIDTRKVLLAQGILTEELNENLIYKYKYYRHAFNNQRLHLCIAPVMICNFSCFYCFEEGNKNLPIMADDVEEAIIQYIENNKENQLSINWFGGEPLLGFDRIVSIANKLNEKKIKFSSSMVTNGSLLTKDKIEKLNLLHLSHIQISLDGLADIHDKRRYFKSGAPSFEVILSNIDNLLKMTSIPLHIQVTIDKTNNTAFDDILILFKRKYPNLTDNRIKIGCNFVQDRTGFEQNSVCYTNDDIFKQKVENLKLGKRNDLTPFLPNLAQPCMYRCLKTFCIDPSGDMYKCLEHLGNPNYKIGNVLEKKISQRKIVMTTFQEDPFEDNECLACKVFPVCGGGCPIDRIKKGKGEDVDCCSIYKTKLAEMLPYLYEYRYNK